jgi:hypothetical protein
MHAVIGRDHRVDGDVGAERHVIGADIGRPVREELLVPRPRRVLEISPAVQVPDQRRGVEALEIRLHRVEPDHGDVEGADPLIDELAEEVGDRVADHRQHHDRLAARLVGEGADLVDQRLEVRMADRHIFLAPGRGVETLVRPVALELLVDRARPDIVRAEHEEALRGAALFAHQVVDGGQHRGGRRRIQVDDVLRILLALEMQRVVQQMVGLLDDRQNRLAADRGPAAEQRRDLLLLDQLTAELGVERPVGAGVGDRHLDLAAEHAAGGVQLLGGHAGDVVQTALDIGHGARGREQAADLDGPGLRPGAADEGGRRKGPGGGAERGRAEALDDGTTVHAACSLSKSRLFAAAGRNAAGAKAFKKRMQEIFTLSPQ